MNWPKKLLFATILFLSFAPLYSQQHFVAREWNEVLLEAIRGDFARPTVHARNLFHTSIALYDAWAVYEENAVPYFLGNTHEGYTVVFDGIAFPEDAQAAQEEAMSYAAYRLLLHRFKDSPQAAISEQRFHLLMDELGYDREITSTNYLNGSPAHLGNYLAEQLIQFGLQDGSNEAGEYENLYYQPVNPDLLMDTTGNPDIVDPNRWQPLSLTVFIDQGGNPLMETPGFLSPEWGNVTPFALNESDRTLYNRDDNDYWVFHDPGAPPYIDTTVQSGLEDYYKWGFAMVAVWSAHLDPADGVMWDISPASIGNNPNLPTDFSEYADFYKFFDGNDGSQGHDLNPVTGQPYEPQMVPRGDYARVLAEFWADGPDSETPPGHWYTILNYVNDNPQLVKKWKGEGPIIDDLEWDVKTYFVLGGAMHDSAISAWSVKGWYDYIRPVSAIRYLAELGQSSDENLPNYHPGGMPLVPGYIELIGENDPLVGADNENLHKIKLLAWRGPDYIDNPATDVAGVDWILAAEWWPYQRPTFVTPPFAGYVSGHSTYSRAAAEVLTLITGDPFFPGGVGEFEAPLNQFLVFEDGPSVDMTLQWATYRDASDQCSLSRIWGGIHPPADDIPGRLIGEQVGIDAFNFAQGFVDDRIPKVVAVTASDSTITNEDVGNTIEISIHYTYAVDTQSAPSIEFTAGDPTANTLQLSSASWTNDSTYTFNYLVLDAEEVIDSSFIRISGAMDLEGQSQAPYASEGFIIVDTEDPSVIDANISTSFISDANAMGQLEINVSFSEVMNTEVNPIFELIGSNSLGNSLLVDDINSTWQDSLNYQAVYFVFDANEEIDNINLSIQDAQDSLGNAQMLFAQADVLTIDTKQPDVLNFEVNNPILSESNVGSEAVQFTISYSEPMNTDSIPEVIFTGANPLVNSLSLNSEASFWENDSIYIQIYDLVDADEELPAIDILPATAYDQAGNLLTPNIQVSVLGIDTRKPELDEISISEGVLYDDLVGSNAFFINLVFDEMMDFDNLPIIEFPVEDPTASISWNQNTSNWLSPFVYRAIFNLSDENVEIDSIDVAVSGLKDSAGNDFAPIIESDLLDIDTKNPSLIIFNANTYDIGIDDIGTNGFSLLGIFDEAMNTAVDPIVEFPVEDPMSLILNEESSSWINSTTYVASFDIENVVAILENIDVSLSEVFDEAGNEPMEAYFADYFNINIPVNVQELSPLSNGILLYPNPVATGNNFNLFFLQELDNVQLKLLDTQGRVLSSKQIRPLANSSYEVSTIGLASGIYFVQLTTASDQRSFKLQVLAK